MMAATEWQGVRDPSWLGSGNFETAAEAYTWAAEIAAEWGQRVRVFPVGRGLVGQLMWDVATADGEPRYADD